MEGLDLQILRAAVTLGTYYPKGQGDGAAAARLAEAGYLRPVRRHVTTVGMPPPPIGYEITKAGREVLEAETIARRQVAE